MEHETPQVFSFRFRAFSCTWGVMCCVFLFGLSGCAAQDDPVVQDSPVVDTAAFDDAIAEADSEFVKSVLKDYLVTPDELSEAVSKASDCMTEHGIEQKVERDVLGVPFILVEASEEESHRRDYSECAEQWIGQIETLSRGEIFNPWDEDDQTLIAACLVRIGLAPAGFSGKDFNELFQQTTVTITVPIGDDDAPAPVVPEPTATPTLPGGIPLWGEETDPCFEEPLRTGLVSGEVTPS